MPLASSRMSVVSQEVLRSPWLPKAKTCGLQYMWIIGLSSPLPIVQHLLVLFRGTKHEECPCQLQPPGKGILQAQWLGLYEVKSDTFRAKLVQLHSCCKWRNRVTQTSSSWVILLQDYEDGGLQLAATHSYDPPWSTRDITASSGLYR